ncbi:hypothetical protein BZG36_00023 [Bifiguratus adelaidae]|uniref:Rho-GAP domain-containing protein n=1 Tax=Bifiguratus adelaidae TaxID=1938954 RepID=A0A261Y8C4_9FUNG|nr:hypothetical protein BZG36_00023 [Bifiguratus adelaidae]
MLEMTTERTWIDITDPQTGRVFYANVVNQKWTDIKDAQQMVTGQSQTTNFTSDPVADELIQHASSVPTTTTSGALRFALSGRSDAKQLESVDSSPSQSPCQTKSQFGAFSRASLETALRGKSRDRTSRSLDLGSRATEGDVSHKKGESLNWMPKSFFGRSGGQPPSNKSEESSRSPLGLGRRLSLSTTPTKRAAAAIGAPTNNPEAAAAMHPLNNGSLYNVPPPSPGLPKALKNDISKFAINGFARQYFATHKRGIFRKTVPVEEMLQWQRDALRTALLILAKPLDKEALKCFRSIQRIMGDRQSGLSEDEEIQSLLDKGIAHGQLRDEIYVQLCKQLTHNPDSGSSYRGWELMCVLTTTFPPSKNLERYLTTFIDRKRINENSNPSNTPNATISESSESSTTAAISTMASYALLKLLRTCQKGSKGKVPTIPEIVRAKESPFKPSAFGESLKFIMQQQATKEDTVFDSKGQEYPVKDMRVPRIVPFLSDAILHLHGQSTEGIFRVPGDVDAITQLRLHIENDNYTLPQGLSDPNVPASLLKYWLRDLTDALIPSTLYEACIQCAKDCEQTGLDNVTSAREAMKIVNQLPEVERRVLLYIIAFLQFFLPTSVSSLTRMNVHNLAMVFAPNFLRCPYDNLTRVFENSRYEQAFVRILIHGPPLTDALTWV